MLIMCQKSGTHSGIQVDFMCLQTILVSEAPKEAPVRKYLPSSVYLEEKTDEQKKEEVKFLIHSRHV